MNWRKPVIYALLYGSASKIPQILEQIQSVESQAEEDLNKTCDTKLADLLHHASRHVPYYQSILSDAGVVRNHQVNLEYFQRVPPLTKETIRSQGKAMFARDRQQRGVVENSSGGSTGEPICLLQDKQYQQWNTAHKIYFNLMQDVGIAQPQIKLWGSERDIFTGREKTSLRLQYWLFNIRNLNSFRMSDAIMSEYRDRWNHFKPRLIWTYASSIFEFGKFLERTGAKVHRPKCIICTAEMLDDQVRQYLLDVFGCPIINQYGSREVGAIACECITGNTLHVFCLHNKIEILDSNLQPCQPGETGDIYVTNLNNYAMPLIRYRIGDMAVASGKGHCACARTWPQIERLTGRRTDHFRTKDGKLVHGEYFTHLFYNLPAILQFQVIQHDYDRIEVIIVSQDDVDPKTTTDIRQKIQLVMGSDCTVSFRTVGEIETTPSGKYRFTISHLG